MLTLARFDAAREFSRFQNDLNNLFDGRLPLGGAANSAARGGETLGWMPAVDIYEDTEGVTLSFDLPDVEAKDVDVRLEDGTLTVRGERKFEHADRREAYHRIERNYGVFSRSFTLPTMLDVEHVNAESKNGVLRIFLPKRAEAKPRTIQVKVN